MPELPEVAVVIDGINEIKGKNTRKVEFSDLVRDNKRYRIDEALLAESKISDIRQRGKYIVFELENSKNKNYMICHLGMSGRLTLEKPEKHCHMTMVFSDDSALYFEDTRRFGFIRAIEGYRELCDELEHVGPSIPEYLKTIGHPFPVLAFEHRKARQAAMMFVTSIRKHCRSSWNMKKVLMDQKAVSGYGNIYASEALFAAMIHPEEELGNVSDGSLHRLFNVSVGVFSRAYLNGGSSISTYRNADGEAGKAQLLHKVYNRESKACVECDSIIVKTRQLGRATFYCPSCQSMEDSKY